MPALPLGPRMPRAAQTAAWIARPGPFMLRARARYGDAFTIRIGAEPPIVMLAHPNAVREVFTGDPAVLHAGKANVILRPLLGRASVLLLDGPEHLRQRKLMLPPFHGSRMAGYRDMVAAIAREHVARWPRGEPLALAPRMQAITLDVVLRVIFGVRDARSHEPVVREPCASARQRVVTRFGVRDSYGRGLVVVPFLPAAAGGFGGTRIARQGSRDTPASLWPTVPPAALDGAVSPPEPGGPDPDTSTWGAPLQMG